MAEDPRAPEPEEGVGRTAGRVSAATATSRVLGLGREAILAALVGAGIAGDAFALAFRIPNLLRDFFAEGALSAAFVPAFARARVEQGEEGAFRLARRIAGTLLLVTGTIAALGMVFAPAVVALVAPDAGASVRELTVHLTRIMFPFLPLAALAAVAMGVLNTHRRYVVPALAPACFNLVAVLGGVVLLLLGWGPRAAVTAWAALVVAGGVVQVLVQVPSLLRVGWRGWPEPDPRFRDAGVRRVVRGMAPVVVATAGTSIMLVIVTALASRTLGWAASLMYAFRLVHLPIGLVGVAVGTVVLAAGSRSAARGDDAGLDGLVRSGLRLSHWLALPAAVGLFVLAEPIIRLVYERGAFGDEDVRQVSAALRGYAVGVVFYAGVKASAPLFLARGDTRTPMLCSLAGIATTIAAAFALVGPMGVGGLALAVALGSAVNFTALRLLGRWRHGPGSAPAPGFLLRVAAASAAMGGLGHLVARSWLSHDAVVADPWRAGGATLLAVAGLGGLYLLLSALLGIEEIAGLRRRWGGRRGR